MAQPEPMPSGEVVGVVTGHHVPSHSRESSTSSTASAASICSNGGLIQTAEEEHTSPIYTPLSKCSSPTANNIIANHSVIIFNISTPPNEKNVEWIDFSLSSSDVEIRN